MFVGEEPSVRVGLFFQSLARQGGGAERRIIDLAGRLAAQDYEVTLISLDCEAASSFYPISPSVRWVKLGFSGGYGDKIRRVFRLHRVLRERAISQLIGFVVASDFTVHAACFLARTNLIVAERNSPIMYESQLTPLRRHMTMIALYLSWRVVVQQKEFLRLYPGYLGRQICVIPNPVDCEVKRANLLQQREGYFEVLFVGRLELSQKRVDHLVRAFLAAADRMHSWRLRLVGDGTGHEALAELIQRSEYRERVVITPSTKNVSDYYEQASLFVLPSRWEGFPNALLEAFAHGIPAITCDDSSGVTTLVKESGGWIAKSEDGVKGLEDTLLSAVSDMTDLAERGELARAYAEYCSTSGATEAWTRLLAGR